MSELNFHKIGEIKEKPIVLIVGEDNFLGQFLNKALLLYDCQVLFYNENLSKEVLGKIDYVFCFEKNFSLAEKILNLTPVLTKFLFAFGASSGKDAEENKVRQLLEEKKVNYRTVRYPFIYGPGMKEEDFQFLKKADSLSQQQALFITDFIYGLLKAMFGGQTKKQSFVLIGENKNLAWRPKVSFEQGLSEMKKALGEEKKSLRPKIKINLKINFGKKKIDFRKSLFYFLLLFLILTISFPVTSLALWGWLGTQSLKQAQASALQGDLLKAYRQANLAKNYFQKGESQFEELTSFLEFLGPERIQKVESLFNLGATTAEGLDAFLQAALKTQSLFKAVFQKESIDFTGLIEEIKVNLDQSFTHLSLAETQFNQGSETQLLQEVRGLILQARQAMMILPDLIGLREKQTYLVLLQNNSELRPTGGFIGSFGLLTFNQGQLIDFEVKDVYIADGQLKGHVEPPQDLKKYLGEAGWYLRDSNWDPDFPSSAQRAAWFLEKETGRTVDGVMGLNLTLAQQILKATGEIQLPDYQEKINADNFFERAEYYSEINFFPGSTQKQDFLGSVVRVLFEKIKESDQKVWFKLAKEILPSLRSKDLLFWFSQPSAMTVLHDLDWDGGLKNVVCQPAYGACLADYLLVSEANVGINKANYFLKRSFSHQIKIDQEGQVEETLRLDYHNSSETEAFPAGRYKSYIRLYTPLGTELKSLKIINPLTAEVVEPSEKETKQEHNKQVFGFLLEVPIKESRSVEVVYSLSEKVTGQTNQYLWLLQKQPGIKDESFNFWFLPPSGLQILPKGIKGTQTTEGFVFSPQFDQDLLFEINLVR
jgi:hypothetical protein